ncbi:hypothetical protein [Desulfolutivibrio sulfoxidireducens]|uniref:hypothetical protein n=1 Tax=Desulfolutivibrio sulfoxidireducens TaxID=2773299 RepID=UPI00159E540E|nr:hypothetical protein [Desulfolutivibrio sulfoxidireducens]QLA21276.1 hypothetical protein GD604_16870 [Desulfolutivibrio sulfoxidireducens]
MAEAYPVSLPCRFEGFPGRVRITCGPAFDDLRACPYSYGSRVVCARTPLCGVVQGEYVPGAALPVMEMIFSDTGFDDVFDLKLSFYGYGTFHLAAPGDAFYSLDVVKGVRIQAAGLCRSFETMDLWETGIVAATDLTVAPGATGSVVVDEDAADNSYSVTWYAGEAAGGYVTLSGLLQLGGRAGLAVGEVS